MTVFGLLRNWLHSILDRLGEPGPYEFLPFEPHELARLIRSGKPNDFKKLADGFSRVPTRLPSYKDKSSPEDKSREEM